MVDEVNLGHAVESFLNIGIDHMDGLNRVSFQQGRGGFHNSLIVLVGAGEGDVLVAGFPALNVQTKDGRIGGLNGARNHRLSHLFFVSFSF